MTTLSKRIVYFYGMKICFHHSVPRWRSFFVGDLILKNGFRTTWWTCLKKGSQFLHLSMLLLEMYGMRPTHCNKETSLLVMVSDFRKLRFRMFPWPSCSKSSSSALSRKTCRHRFLFAASSGLLARRQQKMRPQGIDWYLWRSKWQRLHAGSIAGSCLVLH